MAIPMFAAYGVVYRGRPALSAHRARRVPALSRHSDGDRQRGDAAARQHFPGAPDAGHPECDRGAGRGRHRGSLPPRPPGASRPARGISVARRLHHAPRGPTSPMHAERVGAARGDVVADVDAPIRCRTTCSGRRRRPRWCSARCCIAGCTRSDSARRKRAGSDARERRDRATSGTRALAPFGIVRRELVLKEVRLFFRDTTQWSQLILLGRARDGVRVQHQVPAAARRGHDVFPRRTSCPF